MSGLFEVAPRAVEVSGQVIVAPDREPRDRGLPNRRKGPCEQMRPAGWLDDERGGQAGAGRQSKKGAGAAQRQPGQLQ